MRLVCLALLAGCGNAVVIERTEVGGVIVLEGDRDRARPIALREAAAHCGDGKFVVVHEGDEVYDRTPGVDGGPAIEHTEHRLHYRCDEPTLVAPGKYDRH